MILGISSSTLAWPSCRGSWDPWVNLRVFFWQSLKRGTVNEIRQSQLTLMHPSLRTSIFVQEIHWLMSRMLFLSQRSEDSTCQCLQCPLLKTQPDFFLRIGTMGAISHLSKIPISFSLSKISWTLFCTKPQRYKYFSFLNKELN